MKDKLKNTLEHEVELLGRSISVLLLVGLLLIGGTSAALLSSFGTVSGDADVTQAVEVTGAPSTVSYDTVTAGTTTVDSFTVTNNNLETEVDYQLDLQRAPLGSSGDEVEDANMDGVDTGIYEVTESETVLDGDSTLTKEYDSPEDEVIFTVDFDDSSDEDGQLHFDTDNDGTNEFHLGLYGYDFEPAESSVTLVENGNGAVNQWVLNEDADGYTEGSVEGISVDVNESGVITVSVDAEKLGSEFRYGLGVNGGESYTSGDTGENVGASTFDSSDWGTVHPGEEVITGSEDTSQTIEADGSTEYVMVNEWAINLDPSYDYNVTAQVNPDYDQEGQIDPNSDDSGDE